MAKTGENLTISEGRCYAQCRHCGRWLEVTAREEAGWEFFEILTAEFICCGEVQQATFTVEKDYLDFH